VTEQGVPALISSGGTTIQLVGLSSQFSADVLSPPVVRG
jgi:hypothetical protein